MRWVLLLGLSMVIGASARVESETEKPKKGAFNNKAVPTGKTWHCLESGAPPRSAPFFDECFRTRKSCESRSSILPDQYIGAPCVKHRRAQVVTYVENDEARFHAFSKRKQCTARRTWLLAREQASLVSTCRRR